MSRQLKLVIGALVVATLLVLVLYALRGFMPGAGTTPEGYKLLTAMPATEGFEPKVLPPGPILPNESSRELKVSFGYKVGGVPYSYLMAMSFPAGSNEGRAMLAVRHAGHEASVETKAVRRWDEPRKAYAVALQDKFIVEPAVPSLCIKAVIGPRIDSYDLKDGSICIAQRDAAGECHPQTLACGLIR